MEEEKGREEEEGPPQAPYLRGYSEGTGISVGSEQVITCVSIGGNPVAHLQWYRNGQKIVSSLHNVDGVSSAEVLIIAEPEDNGAQYRCEAHNAAAASPVSVSTTLVVYFPPENVKAFTLSFELTSLASAVSGTIVVNKLTLSLTAADDGLTYTCQAFNSALQKAVRQSPAKLFTCRLQVKARKNVLVFRVIYPSSPSFPLSPSPSLFLLPPLLYHLVSSFIVCLSPFQDPASSLGSRKMGNRHPESFLFHRNECPGLREGVEGQAW
ncbi:Nephrin [Portunus trituberculatus]|uniref:Nephrin n=1 Tax=Portunus trituberculatus TaxID=210409 RepID=A0A5B7EWI5_PORTR|nr:Nephrin [Portunus trituberculatus]